MANNKMSVDCSLERLSACASEWKTSLGKALVECQKIANDYEKFAPGSQVLKEAIAFGSLLLNPDSSLENLQRERKKLNSNLEKITLSSENQKLKAVERLTKRLKAKISDLDLKIANPPEEISSDFEKINTEVEEIKSEIMEGNESIEQEIAPIKDVITKTIHSVSDQGYKVCNLINIRFLLYWKHLQHFFW